jgi:hypothetical protein
LSLQYTPSRKTTSTLFPCPVFGEYYTFEWKFTREDLKRLRAKLSIMEEQQKKAA